MEYQNETNKYWFHMQKNKIDKIKLFHNLKFPLTFVTISSLEFSPDCPNIKHILKLLQSIYHFIKLKIKNIYHNRCRMQRSCSNILLIKILLSFHSSKGSPTTICNFVWCVCSVTKIASYQWTKPLPYILYHIDCLT